MIVKAYLDFEKVKGVPGYDEDLFARLCDVRLGYRGHRIVLKDGAWECVLNGNLDEIPSTLVYLVDKVSIQEDIPATPSRERGVYRHETAEAEVRDYEGSRCSKFRVTVTAKTLADAKELLRKIKVGDSCPDESYEGSQSGLSRAELERRLAEANRQLEAIRSSRDLYEGMLRRVGCVMTELSQEWWPFCIKGGVIETVNKIIKSS